MTIPGTNSDLLYGSALADAIGSAERALTEARMPIHILLTTQFGNLNDNQEEMIGAAASALARTAQELSALRALVETDRRVAATRDGPVRVGDIVRALLPELRDQAARSGASIELSIDPGLPKGRGDDSQLRDAIRLALIDDIRFATPGSLVEVTVTATASEIVVGVCSGARRSVSSSLLLADRMLCAQGARLELGDGHTIIGIPRLTVSARPGG